MKIAVAIVKPEMNSLLSDLFGRSDFFLVYDTNSSSEEYLNNPFNKELGGAGIQTARFLIENNVDAVITKWIGINPFRLLVLANIKVYQCGNLNALEALKLFNQGKLILIDNNIDDAKPARNRKRWGKETDNNFLTNK